MNDFYQTSSDLSNYAFMMMPEMLFKNKKLKPIDTLLFTVLQNRVRLSAKNNWLDEDGRVFIVYSDIELEEMTGTSRQTWRRSKERLVKEGLIKMVEDKSSRIRTNYRIYVKKLVDPRMEERKWQQATQESNKAKETITQETTPEQKPKQIKTQPVDPDQLKAFKERLESLKGEQLSQVELKHLKTVLALYGSNPELIEHALELISKEDKKKQNIFYLKGILAKWKYRGLVTVAQVITNEQAIAAYKKRQQEAESRYQSNVPEWSSMNEPGGYVNPSTPEELENMQRRAKELLAQLDKL